MAVTAANIYTGKDGRRWYDISADTTLDSTYCGLVLNMTASGKTLTLPATVVGYNFTVRNGGVKVTNGPVGTGADGTLTVNISPNASDKIMGNGFTAADNKDAINTLGNVGDEVTLTADGVDGYYFRSPIIGTWTKEA